MAIPMNRRVFCFPLHWYHIWSLEGTIASSFFISLSWHISGQKHPCISTTMCKVPSRITEGWAMQLILVRRVDFKKAKALFAVYFHSVVHPDPPPVGFQYSSCTSLTFSGFRCWASSSIICCCCSISSCVFIQIWRDEDDVQWLKLKISVFRISYSVT